MLPPVLGAPAFALPPAPGVPPVSSSLPSVSPPHPAAPMSGMSNAGYHLTSSRIVPKSTTLPTLAAANQASREADQSSSSRWRGETRHTRVSAGGIRSGDGCRAVVRHTGPHAGGTFAPSASGVWLGRDFPSFL